MSAPCRLSPELQHFLSYRVGSLECLQVLAALCARRKRGALAVQVAATLDISEVAAMVALEQLVASGLAEVVTGLTGPSYRLACCQPEEERVLEELMFVYWNARVDLLAEMAGNSLKRVRFHAHQLLRGALRLQRAPLAQG
ncbi:MAG: hypothetical protein QM778_27650 [Myxococcales bacterium]